MKKIYVIFPLLFLFLGIHTAAATDIETLLVSPKILNLVEITDPKQLSTEIKKANLTTEEKTALVSVFLFDAEDIPLLTAAIRSGADPKIMFEGLRPVDFAYMNPKLRDTPALQTLEKSTTAKSFLE